ncbi:hypothetical protein HYH03_013210 [Edaphochlamys debaryana]|uniref:Exostosin GT47 domain-containing protein n=1 Tax=Edaphochlamys debaryana TaxID=47281 RepID=A0A836BT59_9CHLO|nr:hypothetical protein HYH03_013210 [Edaphochlamys debaryana]|eukprot:KAG2488216.1 hypothetical protein HYH03_013210 [Edaphochlamys debaryana]
MDGRRPASGLAAVPPPACSSSRDRKRLLCYQYTDRPEAEQLSDSPPLDHPAIEWREIKPYPTLVEEVLPRDKWPKEVKTTDGGVWRPLKECPDKWFRQWGPAEGPHCNCHGYYEGKSCEIADPYHCYRNCSGVGECVRGWCHCQPGYWGHGCTRRKAYTSSVGWLPNHADLKIYVYDLPEMVAHRREFNDWWSLIDGIYLAELEFIDQLLGDWSVRTENPWEGNTGGPYLILDRVSRYLQQTSPFWNATKGRNHVFFASNDQGACKLEWAPSELQHSIKVVHYGLAQRRPYEHHNHAPPGQHGMGALPLAGHRFEGFPDFTSEAIVAEHMNCYRFDKDVVAPVWVGTDWVLSEHYNKVNAQKNSAPRLDMQRAKFCLAPSGHGWGVRLAQAMMTGCVPVIVQDHVYQALWDVLPYEDFAIRISRADLHRIVEILDLVTPDQLIKLQVSMNMMSGWGTM